MRFYRFIPMFIAAVVYFTTDLALGHKEYSTESGMQGLAEIGPAPDFELTTHDKQQLRLSDLRGKVVALTFMFTSCVDVCPLLTMKMVGMQKALGSDFGSNIYFISVTVDPQVDKPEVLAGYAAALGSDTSGWSFLTGSEADIRQMARSYGVIHQKHEAGDVDHNLLTSIIDRNGMLRVQYMGSRFDPKEFLQDLRNLAKEQS